MRDLVVVLGVDRSGSSLCTNLLQLFGAYLGEDLLDANEFNVRGYFESTEALAVNEAILAATNHCWDTLYAPQPLDAEWWKTTAMESCREAAVRFLQDRMQRTENLLAVKDPRFCMLLPLWEEAFGACDLVPRFVLTVRHPSAVAESLATRNGFSITYSELYWLEHYYFAAEAIRGQRHCIVHYEDWFTNPIPQAQTLWTFLGLDSEGNPEALTSHLQSAVDPQLCHNGRDPVIQLRAVERLYRCLRSAHLPARQLLEEVRSDEDIAQAYARVGAGEGSHQERRGSGRDREVSRTLESHPEAPGFPGSLDTTEDVGLCANANGSGT